MEVAGFRRFREEGFLMVLAFSGFSLGFSFGLGFLGLSFFEGTGRVEVAVEAIVEVVDAIEPLGDDSAVEDVVLGVGVAAGECLLFGTSWVGVLGLCCFCDGCQRVGLSRVKRVKQRKEKNVERE